MKTQFLSSAVSIRRTSALAALLARSARLWTALDLEEIAAAEAKEKTEIKQP